MAENDKASRMAKLRAILNADAAIITILLAVGGGIIHVTNQISILQSMSDVHTKQIDGLHDANVKGDAKMDWVMRQLDMISIQTNAPRPFTFPPAWPSVPQAEQPIAAEPPPPQSLFEVKPLPPNQAHNQPQNAINHPHL